MMKTIIIAVCSAVAYLAVVIGLTVYCSIRLVKARSMRKAMVDSNTTPIITGPGIGNHGELGFFCDISIFIKKILMNHLVQLV